LRPLKRLSLGTVVTIRLWCFEAVAVILITGTALEWRNWQTHGTQNPAELRLHEGSTPSSSTMKSIT
jgi:hypothetical protein